jgi:hypothetical protein
LRFIATIFSSCSRDRVTGTPDLWSTSSTEPSS